MGLAKQAEASLKSFVQQAWPIIEPGTAYLHNWHIDAICEDLEAVSRFAITRELINIPPRYMKSTLVAIMWPVWVWTWWPESRWLFTSYSADLSTTHSLSRRRIIEHEWYQRNWGERVQLAHDQNEKTEFANTRQGLMIATSLSGTATGKGGDFLVVDDPHNPKQAESDVERTTAVRDFKRTFSTRLNDKRRGAIVVVMQRLHAGDISAEALSQGYHHLCLPAEAETRSVVTMASGRQIVREEGSLLWPEREGPAEIKQAKRAMGSYAYAGQYQQRPAPAGGGKFQAGWFRYFEDEGEFYVLHDPDGDKRVLKSETWRFITADLALSTKEGASWTVIATWVVTQQADCMLVNIHRARMESPEVEVALGNAYTRWDPSFVGVEKAHFGVAVCQKFMRKGLPLKELVADKDKVTRSLSASVDMENGKFYFLAGAPWLSDYETELLWFPNGEYDDQVDVTSYAAIVLAQMGGFGKGDILRGRTRQTVQIDLPQVERPRMSRPRQWHEVSG
jgi:predicted phage terminase large subunit-like protein